jgi:hypothetical protein
MSSCSGLDQLHDATGCHTDLEVASDASPAIVRYVRLVTMAGRIDSTLERLGLVMSGFGMSGAVNMLGYGFEAGLADTQAVNAGSCSKQCREVVADVSAVSGLGWLAR